MKWPDFKKKKKIKETETRHHDVVCKNCETQFKGNFCPECGQSVREYDKPFSFIFYNFVGDFFAFDTRFFKTFLALLLKPGFLTKEYFEGRRVKYAPPFRIFIFTSFVLFYLLQIATTQGLDKLLDSSLDGNGIVKLDSASVAVTDSLFAELNSRIDSVETENMFSGIDSGILKGAGNMRQMLSKLAVILEKQLEEETDAAQKAKLREYIRLCYSPEQAIAKILKYMSWAYFLLLPIFALILKLVYIRREQNYVRHLVFSVHSHSFIFLVLIFLTLLTMLFNGSFEGLSVEFMGSTGFIMVIPFIIIPVYLIIAFKNFYGQSTGKVILKFISVSVVYYIVFWIILGIVFLNALSII